MRVGWGLVVAPGLQPVLHWTQDLRLHIHVHAVMACGAGAR
ncbi:hypothetical protein [Candidatus Aalborgicola defluviihabitans]